MAAHVVRGAGFEESCRRLAPQGLDPSGQTGLSRPHRPTGATTEEIAVSTTPRPLETISRRWLTAAGLATFATCAGAATGFAQPKKGPAAPAEVSVDELMKAGPIPDMVLGKADAPVTIVEYASLTCGHCANFHNTVFPKLKEKYIDTGKAKLILREFPLDNLAAAAAMLARCAGDGKSYDLVSSLFKSQDQWAFVQGNPVPALFKVAEGSGFTKESFDKCLTDQKLLEGITATRDRANKTFAVNATPAFFINGKRLDGRADQVETFEKMIEPILGGASGATAPAPATPEKKK